MSKLRELKRRIKSVNNIGQVTHAMEMIAASRMKKSQDNASRGKDYAERIREMMIRLVHKKAISEYDLLNPELSKTPGVMVVVFSPQRGLAGGLPTNLTKAAVNLLEDLQNQGKYTEVVTVGNKVRDKLVRMGYNIVADFPDIPEQPTTADIRPVLMLIENTYQNTEVGKVLVVYPEFVNAMVQQPRIKVLLPIDLSEIIAFEDIVADKWGVRGTNDFKYEPSQRRILEELVPRYLETQIYQARLETVASEYSARMIAMKSATENANEIGDDLTLDYNKSRQAQITAELAEIVSARI